MSTARTLLIVDDALFMRALVRDALGGIFSTVLEADDVASAVEKASSEKVDMVTLDLSLDPDEMAQGLDVLETIRHCIPPSRVIVLSALNQDWIRAKLDEIGVAGYIIKPFQADALQAAAREILEKDHG